MGGPLCVGLRWDSKWVHGKHVTSARESVVPWQPWEAVLLDPELWTQKDGSDILRNTDDPKLNRSLSCSCYFPLLINYLCWKWWQKEREEQGNHSSSPFQTFVIYQWATGSDHIARCEVRTLDSVLSGVLTILAKMEYMCMYV